MRQTHGTTTSNAGCMRAEATWHNNSEWKDTTFASHLPTPMEPLLRRKDSFLSKIVRPGRTANAHITSSVPMRSALVRFGLRAPDDPRILNTLRAIDALLAVEVTPRTLLVPLQRRRVRRAQGWIAFDGTGIGRPWPLLAGERAHYALAAGHRDEAEALLTVMENSTAGHSRLLPEQVWDAADIPALELFRGKPSGSACPLVWAHSEYIKLRRSIRDGKVFDQPPQTVQRYLVETHVQGKFSAGDSTIKREASRGTRRSASCCCLQHGCIGASITGKLRMIPTPATPGWAFTSSICPPLPCRLGGQGDRSPSSGLIRIAGRVQDYGVTVEARS